MNIVAIGAHPDDLEIFTFGFLAAASARGDTLYLGVATDGAAGGENPGPALATQRAKETSTALAPLGTPTLLGLPDGRLADAPEAREQITDFIRAATPDLVITHAPEDYHPDHRALSSFVTDAVGFILSLIHI